MRKWIRLAAHLYPSTWRRRYGAEFEALLDDADPKLRDVFDVLRGAIKMQMSFWNSRNITLACGLAGLILATGTAFRLPNLYVSRALLRITPSQIPENMPPDAFNQQMADRVDMLWAEVVSRGNLAKLIKRPDLDLYKSERAHQPLEDVIERMKMKDIKLDLLSMAPSAKALRIMVSFEYPDRVVAQATTAALVSQLVDANFRARSTTLDLLDVASLPQGPAAPNRPQIVVIGLTAGLLTGILVAWFRRKSPA